ncbi:MAG: polysaccharide deacetylase family protein [Clostridiales bacterium]|nr:polysaccharide deacetylase family protein [Clostridiales bacterium]
MKNKFMYKILEVALSAVFVLLTTIQYAVPRGLNKDIAANLNSEGIKVPIIMYHSILKYPTSGDKYTVTPYQLEEDIKYILDKGYTPIPPSRLIKYVYDGVPLPSNPVILSFDDGYYNNYTYLSPLLEKYGIYACIGVIGVHSERFSQNNEENNNYGHLTWERIREMTYKNNVEILNHSFDMHSQSPAKGCLRRPGESTDEYKTRFTDDVIKNSNVFYRNGIISPPVYVYPFGAYSEESERILKDMGYLMTFSCTERVSTVTRDPQSLYLMGRYNRDGSMSTPGFMKKIGIE